MSDRPLAAGVERPLLRWVERALWLGGVLCLSWVFIIWSSATLYQAQAKKGLAEAIAASRSPGAASTPAIVEPLRGDKTVIGVIDVPRLGLSAAVLEGDGDQILQIAVGHLPDTPLPWNAGNAALAAHRDGFFRPLQHLREGDNIELTTRHGTFQYRVRRMMIVAPTDLSVLDAVEGVDLTLITCYPFTYVGLAPQRFVAQAERVSSTAPIPVDAHP